MSSSSSEEEGQFYEDMAGDSRSDGYQFLEPLDSSNDLATTPAEVPHSSQSDREREELLMALDTSNQERRALKEDVRKLKLELEKAHKKEKEKEDARKDEVNEVLAKLQMKEILLQGKIRGESKLQRRLHIREGNIQAMNSRINELTDQLRERNDNLESMGKQLRQLSVQLQMKEEGFQGMKKEMDELAQQFIIATLGAGGQEETSELQKELEKTRKNNEVAGTMLKGLSELLKTKETGWKEAAMESQKKIEGLQKELEWTETVLGAARKEVEKKIEEVHRVTEDKNDVSQKLETLQMEANNLRQDIVTLEQALDEERNRTEVSDLPESIVESMTAMTASKDREIESLRLGWDNSCKELHSVRKRLQECEEQRKKAEVKANYLSKRIENLEKEAVAKQRKIEDLSNEMNVTKGQKIFIEWRMNHMTEVLKTKDQAFEEMKSAKDREVEDVWRELKLTQKTLETFFMDEDETGLDNNNLTLNKEESSSSISNSNSASSCVPKEATGAELPVIRSTFDVASSTTGIYNSPNSSTEIPQPSSSGHKFPSQPGPRRALQSSRKQGQSQSHSCIRLSAVFNELSDSDSSKANETPKVNTGAVTPSKMLIQTVEQTCLEALSRDDKPCTSASAKPNESPTSDLSAKPGPTTQKVSVSDFDTGKSDSEDGTEPGRSTISTSGTGMEHDDTPDAEILKYLELNRKEKKSAKSNGPVLHGVDSAKYLTCLCGKHYRNLQLLKNHVWYFTNGFVKTCELCPQTFRTVGHLNGHLRRDHSIDIPLQRGSRREKTKKGVDTPTDKKQEHKFSHESFRILPLETSLEVPHEAGTSPSCLTRLGKQIFCTCGEQFPTRTLLQQHLEEVAKNSKVFNCKMCSTSFKTKRLLKNHVVKTHKGNVTQEEDKKVGKLAP